MKWPGLGKLVARITAAPTTTAIAVSSMGRKRTAPASTTASASGMPSANEFNEVHQDDQLRTTMPAPAMKPIIEVAVRRAQRPCAGRMPTSEKGIAIMTIIGVRKERNQPTIST